MPKRPKPLDAADPVVQGEQRINKVLAAAGLGSRRQVDELIEQGRVEIDGKVVQQVGVKVQPDAVTITVDGEPLKRHRPVYFALHKPEGVLCTNRDPQGRPRVVDMVPNSARLFPVGRLDAASTGLILLTNDGELAQRLAHPKHGVPKRYAVVVAGQVELDSLKRLEKGIHLAEGRAKVDNAKIRRLRKGCTELEITLSEGKNREIRRVLARLGHKVVSLKRIAIGPLKLGEMPDGAYRPLSQQEVTALYAAVEALRKARKEERKARKKKLASAIDAEHESGDESELPTRELPAKEQRPRRAKRDAVEPLPKLSKNPFATEEDLDEESLGNGKAPFEDDAVLIRDHDLPEDEPWIAPTSKRFGKVLADDDDEGFLEDHDADDDEDGPFLAFPDDEDDDEDADAFAFDDDTPPSPKRTPEAQRMHKRLGKQPKGRRSAQRSGPEVMGSRGQRAKPQRSENAPRARRPSSRRTDSAEDADIMAPRPERRGKFARSGSPSRSPTGKKLTKGTPTGPGRRGASRSSLGKSGPGKRGPGKPKASRSGPGRPSSGRPSSGRPSSGKPSANKKRRGR